MSTASSHNDPFASFKFIVDIDIQGMRAGFSEVEGLPKEHGAVEHRHGDEGAKVRKIPGMRKYTNLHFKRGFTNSKDLWEWHKDAMDGNTRRPSGTITLLDEARKPLLVWKFREAWPSKWEGPALNAKTSEVAIEEMEIAVEGLELTASTRNQKP